MLTRREILMASPGLLVACKGPSSKESEACVSTAASRTAEPSRWEPKEPEDVASFSWGVQSGDATSVSVIVSVRCLESEVVLVVMEENSGEWVEFSRSTHLCTEETLQVLVEGLGEDRVYCYAFFGATGRSRVGRFRSAPLTGRRVVRLGATSCLGGNVPWPNLSKAAAEDLDGFLLLGDTVYADGAVSLEEYREFWRTAFSYAGLQDVTASCSMIATWDDHEVGNNWRPDTLAEGQFEAAKQAFVESLPQGVGPSGGIWRKLSFGETVDVLVLDCRGERVDGRYISAEQMEWLKAELQSSKSRFKLIINSVPINDYTDMLGDAYVEDRWQGYPEQRTEILEFIRDQAISGVLWVAGDVHHAMVCHPDLKGPGADQWEVACGPSGSKLNVTAELYQDTTGHYPILFAAWNYTRFTLDPSAGTIKIDFIGDDGSIIDAMTLSYGADPC